MRASRLSLTLALLALPVLTGAGGAPDWDAWFKKNVMASDKGDYVHLFWNAQDVRTRFKGKSRVALLAQAARELATRQYPKAAKADLVKIDIVYVRERDEYGMPKWSTLERAAHLEGSKAALLKLDAAALRKKDAEIQGKFSIFKLY
jgi:hypothetical protein